MAQIPSVSTFKIMSLLILRMNSIYLLPDNEFRLPETARTPSKLELDSLTPPRPRPRAIPNIANTAESTSSHVPTVGNISVVSSPSIYSQPDEGPYIEHEERFSASSTISQSARTQPPCYHEDVHADEIWIAGGPLRDSDYMD